MAVGMCGGCGNERNACACSSGGLLEIPPFVKSEMRKHMAFLRLIDAAKALLAENTETAQASYNEPGTRFTDAQWKGEDPENFKLCREVRNAIKEAARSLAHKKDIFQTDTTPTLDSILGPTTASNPGGNAK